LATNERTLKDHLSLTERVYATLREMILSMELPPGTRLKDVDLAQRLGVSNTPLREAMRLLAADSLVETIPRRGTVVKTLSAEESGLLYEIREALEVLATRLVARRAKAQSLQTIMDVAESHRKAVELGNLHEYLDLDRRFHSLIAEGSQNPILVSMLNMIADRIHIVRRMTSNLEKDVLTGIEHHEIASALMRRDDSKATALMQQHIRRHGERIRVFLMSERGEASGGSEDNFIKGE
jgi:DNA-binding GntR family transcriptional regulator